MIWIVETANEMVSTHKIDRFRNRLGIGNRYVLGLLQSNSNPSSYVQESIED